MPINKRAQHVRQDISFLKFYVRKKNYYEYNFSAEKSCFQSEESRKAHNK